MSAAIFALLLALPGVTHVPRSDACAEAAAFGSEPGDEADRARRRCRLLRFRQELENRRRAEAARAEEKRALQQELWARDHLPVRATREYLVSMFAGSGPAAWGAAASYALAPSLEVEAWIGRNGSRRTFTYQRGGKERQADLEDQRTMFGARARWSLRPRNLTPFISGGVAGIWSGVGGTSWSTAGGGEHGGEGYGRAHALSASAGLTWSWRSGFSIGVEYLLCWPFYVNVVRSDVMHGPQDEELGAMWQSKLLDEARGPRAQVGYAF